jgi:hypothetical protein
MHYLVDIIILCRTAISGKRKVKYFGQELILSTLRGKSVPEFEKMR